MTVNVPSRVYDETANTFEPYKQGAFDQYVSFCALGGLITSDDGQISTMTLSQFCQQLGIDRKTAYRWRQMRGFADKVRDRRDELFPLARESACWNQLFLIGMTSLDEDGKKGHGDHKAAVQALTILLGHFSGLKLPARRQPEPANQGNSWVELLTKARQQGIVED